MQPDYIELRSSGPIGRELVFRGLWAEFIPLNEGGPGLRLVPELTELPWLLSLERAPPLSRLELTGLRPKSSISIWCGEGDHVATCRVVACNQDSLILHRWILTDRALCGKYSKVAGD